MPAGVTRCLSCNATLARSSGKLQHATPRRQRNFNSLPRFRLNAVPVKELPFFHRRWYPAFDEAITVRRDAKGSLRTEYLHRECIKELVGEDEQRNRRR